MILLHGAMPLHAQVFISLDTQNTGKLTLPMMVELLQRYTQYSCNSWRWQSVSFPDPQYSVHKYCSWGSGNETVSDLIKLISSPGLNFCLLNVANQIFAESPNFCVACLFLFCCSSHHMSVCIMVTMCSFLVGLVSRQLKQRWMWYGSLCSRIRMAQLTSTSFWDSLPVDQPPLPVRPQ